MNSTTWELFGLFLLCLILIIMEPILMWNHGHYLTDYYKWDLWDKIKASIVLELFFVIGAYFSFQFGLYNFKCMK